jgi:hypothetical protein
MYATESVDGLRLFAETHWHFECEFALQTSQDSHECNTSMMVIPTMSAPESLCFSFLACNLQCLCLHACMHAFDFLRSVRRGAYEHTRAKDLFCFFVQHSRMYITYIHACRIQTHTIHLTLGPRISLSCSIRRSADETSYMIMYNYC